MGFSFNNFIEFGVEEILDAESNPFTLQLKTEHFPAFSQAPDSWDWHGVGGG